MNRCPYCLSEFDKKSEYCPFCGSKIIICNMIELPADFILNAGRYSIIKKISRGGFGITYLALDKKKNIEIVVKEFMLPDSIRKDNIILPPDSFSADDYKSIMEKFKEEALILSRLESPLIVKVFDIFEENNTVYYTMEYFNGQTLETFLKTRKIIKENEVINIIQKICDALITVHSKKIIHRDIKPENILINDKKEIKLIDFGSAREFIPEKTIEMTKILTPNYAAPEQYLSEGRFSQVTDIYSLGALMYRLLTGENPVSSLDRLIKKTNLVSAGNEFISDDMVSIINKCTAIDINRRYQSCTEIKRDLNMYLQNIEKSFAMRKIKYDANIDIKQITDFSFLEKKEEKKNFINDNDLLKYEKIIDKLSSELDLAEEMNKYEILIKRGKAYSIIFEKEKSVNDFQNAINLFPEKNKAYLYYGKYLIESNEEEGIRYIDKVLENDPDNIQALFSKALYDFTMRNYVKTIEILKHVFDLDKNDIDAVILTIKTYLKIQKYDEAMKLVNEQLKRDNKNNEFIKLKAEISFLMKDYENSLYYYNKIIDADKEDYISYYFMGVCSFYSDKNDEALRYFESSVRINKNFFPSKIAISEVLANKKEFMRAVEILTEVINNHGGYAVAFYFRALNYISLNKKNKALNDLTEAIKLDSSNYKLYDLRSRLYEEMEVYEKAKEDIEKIIILFPGQAEYFIRNGKILLKQTKLSEAAENFRQAEKYSPDEPEILITLAKLLENKEPEISFQYYQKYFEHLEDLSVVEKLVDFYIKFKKEEKAIEILKKAYEKSKDMKYLYLLMPIYEKKGEKENYNEILQLIIKNEKNTDKLLELGIRKLKDFLLSLYKK